MARRNVPARGSTPFNDQLDQLLGIRSERELERVINRQEGQRKRAATLRARATAERERAQRLEKAAELRAKARGFRDAAEMARVQRSAAYRAFVRKSVRYMELTSSAELTDSDRKKITRMWRLRQKHQHSEAERNRTIVRQWLEMLGYDIAKNTGKEGFDY